MKIYYTLDESGLVTLGNINEVHITYEDIVESTAVGDNSFKKDSEETFEDSDSGEVNMTEEIIEDSDSGEVDMTEETIIDSTKEENLELAKPASNEGKESTVNEGATTTQAASPASFTDSERAELEALKKEKKLALISKYEEYLSEEDKEDLTTRIDEFSVESLELELLKIYKKVSEENFMRMAPLAAPEPKKPETADTQLNSYIQRMLGK